MDLLIVGSGFFGLTVARLAAEDGFKVEIIEKRNHPGGNAWSDIHPGTEIEVHKYGSHLFHTSNEQVWNFVNRFSGFNAYEHRVYSRFGDQVFPLPVNLMTINSFFKKALNPEEAKTLLGELSSPFSDLRDVNLEGRALSLVGRELYEALFAGYTKKQWETDPKSLPAEVISRLPLRFNYNSRYFQDRWEGLPTKGYAGLITEMLNHDNVLLRLGVDYFSSATMQNVGCPTVYTGPVDQFFDYAYGELGWRTLDFEWELLNVEDFQGCAVMNYADESVPYTRIHEFKHLHPERPKTTNTVISREYSRISKGRLDEPYYPISSREDRSILSKYRDLAAAQQGVIFGGRLGTYQYLDMHMAIASAMQKYEAEIKPLLEKG